MWWSWPTSLIFFFPDLYFLKHGVLGENRNPEETCPNFPVNFYEFWFPLLISILINFSYRFVKNVFFYLFRFCCDWKIYVPRSTSQMSICLRDNSLNMTLKAMYVPHPLIISLFCIKLEWHIEQQSPKNLRLELIYQIERKFSGIWWKQPVQQTKRTIEKTFYYSRNT